MVGTRLQRSGVGALSTKVIGNSVVLAYLFQCQSNQQSLPIGFFELSVWALRCPKAKSSSRLVARVAQDGPKRGQEGPRWPKLGPKMAPEWSRHALSKPRGGVWPPGEPPPPQTPPVGAEDTKYRSI